MGGGEEKCSSLYSVPGSGDATADPLGVAPAVKADGRGISAAGRGISERFDHVPLLDAGLSVSPPAEASLMSFDDQQNRLILR